MTNNADAVIAALRTGHDELAAIVGEMGEKDLTGATGASEWDVSQVLSHLGSGAEINLATLEASLEGKPNPGREFNMGVWARWDAMTPAQRAAEFPEANEKLIARYEALDTATRAGLKVDMGFLPQPVDVATAAGFRLSEYTFHSWDVRVGADSRATLADDAVPLLTGFTGGMLNWLAKSDALDGRELTVRVETTGPSAVYGLKLAEPVALVEAPAEADGVLRLPAEAWLRLLTGRLSLRHTPSAVDAEGAADLDLLRQVFRGF